MIRNLSDLELQDKTVFVRVDFNVPIEQGRITEPHRIDSALATIRFILERAQQVVIASHLGRPNGNRVAKYSLAPVCEYLERVLGQPVILAPDCIGADVERILQDPGNRVVLLENLRFHQEEEQNDRGFSQALAALADIYVNDAFGAAHRAHASIAGITAFFKQKGAGLLMQKELEYLKPILSDPEKPFITVLGGAKVSDKIGVIKNLLPRVDALLVGGGMAYTFLKAKGMDVGNSLLERDKIALAGDIMKEATARGVRILLPTDHVTGNLDKKDPTSCAGPIPAERMGLDIGPETASLFATEIAKAKMVLWNGPVGLFEVPPYDQGSRTLAKALADQYPRVISIIAGGDTVAAVTAAGCEEKISHLSTGGGATLEYLEGKELPGIRALENDQ